MLDSLEECYLYPDCMAIWGHPAGMIVLDFRVNGMKGKKRIFVHSEAVSKFVQLNTSPSASSSNRLVC